jgi:hypothetical protein
LEVSEAVFEATGGIIRLAGGKTEAELQVKRKRRCKRTSITSPAVIFPGRGS